MVLISLIATILAACSTKRNEAKVREKLLGTWRADWDASRTLENRADGSFVTKFTIDRTNAVTIEGEWRVQGGFIVGTMTNSSWPNVVTGAESNKIISVSENKLVVLGRDGGTNELVLSRVQ